MSNMRNVAASCFAPHGRTMPTAPALRPHQRRLQPPFVKLAAAVAPFAPSRNLKENFAPLFAANRNSLKESVGGHRYVAAPQKDLHQPWVHSY